MKVGIITFHNSTNYGAVLQALALQKKLEIMGHDVEIIDYVCKNKIRLYKPIKLRKTIRGNIEEIRNYPFKSKKNKIMYSFMDREYRMTKEKFYDSSEIAKVSDKWDMVITGSDQVWNYYNTGFDTTYLLDFIDDSKKKMSYAASFGVDEVVEKYSIKYKELLTTFTNISVREEQGRKIVKELTGKDAQLVLDPTLLFNGDEWRKIIRSDKEINEKYILFYSLHDSEGIKKLLNLISDKTGYKVIKIASKGVDLKSKEYETIIADPLEFIRLIDKAEVVVTDSFHGVAFSINLNKKFYVYFTEGINSYSRVTNLLNLSGLENRIVNNFNFNIDDCIDYMNVNKRLEEKRNKSIEFINNSLK